MAFSDKYGNFYAWFILSGVSRVRIACACVINVKTGDWSSGALASWPSTRFGPGRPWGPSEILGNASTIASLVPTVIEYRGNAYVNPVGSSILV